MSERNSDDAGISGSDENAETGDEQAVAHALWLREEGRMDDAISFLYDILAKDLTNSEVIGVLATMLSETEQFDRAERLFQRALKEPNPNASVILNYATFLSHSGRHDEAQPRYSDATAHAVGELQKVLSSATTEPPGADALIRLAMAECNQARTHMELGHVEIAKALAEKWLVFQMAWGAAADIVWSCIEIQGLDEVSEMKRYHEARRASPDMVAALFHLAGKEPAPAGPINALHMAAEASAYLHFNWPSCVEDFEEELRVMAEPARLMVKEGKAPTQLLQTITTVGEALGEDWSGG